jgi:ribonuclease G
MTGSIIVINVDIRETRVALVEGGVIAELQIERASHRGTVGNIVLGKVTRVLPGMQAAFIDVGQERSAFLHVEDLIRPDDFERYLAGGVEEEGESFRGAGGRKPAAQKDEDDEEEDDDDEAPAALNGASGPAEHQEARAPVLEELGADLGTDEDEDLDAEDAEDSAEDEPIEGPVDEADDDDNDDVVDVESEDLDSEDEDELAGPSDSPLVAEDEGDDEADEADVEGDDDEVLAAHSDAPAVTADTLTSVTAVSVAISEVEVSFGLESDGPLIGERRSARSTAVEATGVVTREPLPAGRPGAAPMDRGRGDARDRNRPAARENVRVDADAGRGGRQRRGRGGPQGSRGRRGRQRNEPAAVAGDAKLVRGRRPPRGKNNNGGGARPDASVPPRVTRAVPITEVVKEGDHVVVQISKEPIGTKGARVTSHVSLPGRYVVYLPTVDHLGISKRIGSARERQRLRQVMESLKPARGGLIVRTVAEGLTKKQLKADVGYLIRVWAEVCKKREAARSAEVLYTELDLVLKVARDLFTDEVKTIVIDDREQYNRLVRFVEMFLPERVKDIELYTGSEPIFDAYGIEDEIGRALSRKVPLPSGGSLIVDQAEALTAIDVNTGRYVGKGSKDLEETALKTNLEAVEEIAYQLRFRNIGGLVILDLIDMEKYSNREKVWRALEAALVKDKAKTTLNRISELGLIEMTRKRTRESLGRMLHEPCFYCDGTGQIQSKATIAYEILRQIGRERYSLPGYSVVVNAHPAIVDFLKTVDRAALDEAERRYARRIELNQRTEYHIEQYDLQGK